MENSSQWINDFFIQRGELFLQILNHMWHQSEPIVDGIVELARANGVASGKVLDICCGNGRIAIPLAKRSFIHSGEPTRWSLFAVLSGLDKLYRDASSS